MSRLSMVSSADRCSVQTTRGEHARDDQRAWSWPRGGEGEGFSLEGFKDRRAGESGRRATVVIARF
jgi:hypothetical protein